MSRVHILEVAALCVVMSMLLALGIGDHLGWSLGGVVLGIAAALVENVIRVTHGS